jgi:glycosyltransferase involved in cell wall biosynthesis
MANSSASRTPLVSILVPTYNAARYLPELCQSIQAQTYPHFEVIIGDDGSTDNTASVMAPFLQDSRFRVLRWEQNRGVGIGSVIMLSAMRGDYWGWTGADDVYYPTFLEKRVALLEANPQACLAHGPAELINEFGQPPQGGPGPLPLSLPPALRPPRLLPVLVQHNIIMASSALIRTSATRPLLPYLHWDWLYASDWFFYILLAATGFELVWDPLVHNKYRVHSTSLSISPEKDHLRRAERRLVPLVGLRLAAQYSQWGAECWGRWGRVLYWQWLRQAVALKSRGGLRPEWTQLGARAYYTARGKPVSFPVEIGKHALGILATDLSYRHALKRQGFPVSGLAQIDDPIFR